MAFREGGLVEFREGGVDEFDILIELGLLVRGDGEALRRGLLAGFDGGDQAVVADIETATEQSAGADGPDHRADVERKGVGDFIEQFEGVLALAVDLVDEGGDGDVAQAADLEEFFGLQLDALGGVDHHDRGIDGGEGAVGILGEILVAGRIQQVEDGAAEFEGHDRAGDGNAALALDLHPVRTGLAAVLAGLDHAGFTDGAAEQQQFFGERGFAGVRVRDDGEGAAGRNVERRRRVVESLIHQAPLSSFVVKYKGRGNRP